jgi:ornithine cyclodeaminase/alanine dehydrogenase-like protein (mu-crystallin family)
MRVIDTEHTRSGLPFKPLVDSIRAMFISGCEVPPRHIHRIATQREPATMLLMPAWQTGGRLGVKTVNVFPSNVGIGIPSLHSTYLLYDANTGVPLAQLDGNEITSRRTAAASALAASMLSRASAHRLLVVGAGRVASLVPGAMRTVREIQAVDVWDINKQLAAQLVARLRQEGFEAAVAESLEDAARRADIISCATLSQEPLIRGGWLRPGVHVDLIGGFTPETRETDDDCFRNAQVFIDTQEALIKAGDLLFPMKSGVLRKEDVRATLEDLCRGRHPGRRSETDVTVYKAVGTALEDLAAACLVYDSYIASL